MLSSLAQLHRPVIKGANGNHIVRLECNNNKTRRKRAMSAKINFYESGRHSFNSTNASHTWNDGRFYFYYRGAPANSLYYPIFDIKFKNKILNWTSKIKNKSHLASMTIQIHD